MDPYFRRIERAVLAIAPERIDELVSTVFRKKQWHLIAKSGSPVAGINPFVAYPANKKITVTYAGLAMVWCLSVYAALTLDVVKQANGQQSGPVDVGEIFGKAQKFLDYATLLRTHDEDWPTDLYVPVEGRADEPCETIDRIFYGAVSWILLHEIAHVHLQHKADLLPIQNIPQEEDADQFATGWVFEKVASNEERELRILVVGGAIAWLLLFEPIGGDPSHPPAVTRMMHVASYFNAQQDSVALEIVAHLLKILFVPRAPVHEFANSEDLFNWTIALFR